MDLFSPTAYVKMLQGRLLIGSSSATALRVGDSNLDGRKWLWIQNASNQPIYIGSQYLLSGTPTTITVERLGKVGIKMAQGDAMWLPVSENITVYVRTHSGNGLVRVMELA